MPVADFSLNGKVAIVTGGSRGIGRSIALGLAEHGADIVLAARKPDDLKAAAEEIQKLGRRVLTVPTNVRKIEELQALVDQSVQEFGRVDVLINNAGTNPYYGPIQDADERAWDVIMNTNAKAVHFLSNAFREAVLKHGDGGTIVNVSSLGGLRASAVIPVYSVSKAALIMLTQVQALTWGDDGIRVNCIAPGLIKTEFAKALWDNPTILKQSTANSAIKRVAEPDEIAGLAVFLASPASSYVTGQTITIDGGSNI